MKTIQKQDSKKTDTKQCYCYKRDIKENQHSIVVANPPAPLLIRCRLRHRLQSLRHVVYPPPTPPFLLL